MSSENFLSHTPQSLFNRAFSSGKAFLANLDWKLILLLGLPLLLVVLNDNWLFSHVLRGKIDNWVYFGYFLDLEQLLNTFDGTYYGTRLPWILPGFLAYRLFSPLIAAYVLHLVFYYAAVIALYLILKHAIGRRTALLTTMLMSCHCFFLEAIGGDYIDGAGLTYFLLTLLMLTNAIRCQTSRLCLCLAGGFCGCLIYTQLFLITFTPLIALYYLFLNRENKQLSLKFDIRFFALGFIGLTVFLCSVNYFLNGRFFFFVPIIKWTVGFVSTEVNPAWSPLSTWWMKATWLIFPSITLFGSVLILIFHRITRTLANWRFVLFSQIYFILTILIFVIWEIIAKQPVLSMTYYASYMLPAMFLAVGSQLAIVVNKLSRRRFCFLASVTIMSGFLAYIPMVNFRWLEPLNFYPILLPMLLGIAGVVGIIIQYRYSKEIAMILIFISLAVINIRGLRDLQSTNHDAAFQKQAFLTVCKSVQTIKKMDPQVKALFWYNYEPPLGSIFRAIASTHLWGYRLVNEEFPIASSKVFLYHPTVGDRIFILASDKNALEEANQNLARIGFKGEFINEKTIHQGPISYKITLLKVCNLNEDVSIVSDIKKSLLL